MPEALRAPVAISYLALFASGQRGVDHRTISTLCEHMGVAPPDETASHFSRDMGAFRLKWERHTEFSRIKVIAPAGEGRLFETTAVSLLPEDWVRDLPGELMVATHVLLLPMPKKPIEITQLSKDVFSGNNVIGSQVGGGAGRAYTDFRIHGDGFSRLLVYDQGMASRQAGRMVQRLLEIDTYRMMALLAFPLARELAPKISAQERELAQIATVMANSGQNEDHQLLERLSRLQASIESNHADSHYRFSAARAYHDLVLRRIEELREERLPGLQTFSEFTERRLLPAIQTCNAIAMRQEELSRRVARATQFLSTRVAVASERQNQLVLEAMARRSKLQLRLQETVEGLSVAAVTYYVVGLVGYLAKAIQEVGAPINPAIAMGISIPVVAGLVWYGVRRVRQMVTKDEQELD